MIGAEDVALAGDETTTAEVTAAIEVAVAANVIVAAGVVMAVDKTGALVNATKEIPLLMCRLQTQLKAVLPWHSIANHKLL